jgi:glycosyltransferase involved in cell wall biosynthesis
MRLAILTSHPIQYYAPLFRGIARQADVKVFFAHEATSAQQAAAGYGTEFEWDIDLLGGYAHEFLHNSARSPSALRFDGCDTPQIGEKLASGGFHALLVTGWHLKSYLQGIWAAKRRGIAVLVRGDSHLGTPRGRVKRMAKEFAYPVLLRQFDAALYVGHHNRAYYEHYHYPADRLFHAPHCVDNERFATAASPQARAALRAELGIGPEETVVLFAGRLVAFKRPLDIVDAVAQLLIRGRRARVVVAGSGPLEQDLHARAEAKGVGLHALGFRNQTQMPAIYAAADVLVLPSTGDETWGLVCNEALACGTPIVISDAVGCAPDLASDDVAGRIFPMGDVGALADAIQAIIDRRPSAAAIATKSAAFGIPKAVSGVVEAVKAVTKSATANRSSQPRAQGS